MDIKQVWNSKEGRVEEVVQATEDMLSIKYRLDLGEDMYLYLEHFISEDGAQVGGRHPVENVIGREDEFPTLDLESILFALDYKSRQPIDEIESL